MRSPFFYNIDKENRNGGITYETIMEMSDVFSGGEIMKK